MTFNIVFNSPDWLWLSLLAPVFLILAIMAYRSRAVDTGGIILWQAALARNDRKRVSFPVSIQIVLFSLLPIILAVALSRPEYRSGADVLEKVNNVRDMQEKVNYFFFHSDSKQLCAGINNLTGQILKYSFSQAGNTLAQGAIQQNSSVVVPLKGIVNSQDFMSITFKCNYPEENVHRLNTVAERKFGFFALPSVNSRIKDSLLVCGGHEVQNADEAEIIVTDRNMGKGIDNKTIILAAPENDCFGLIFSGRKFTAQGAIVADRVNLPAYCADNLEFNAFSEVFLPVNNMSILSFYGQNTGVQAAVWKFDTFRVLYLNILPERWVNSAAMPTLISYLLQDNLSQTSLQASESYKSTAEKAFFDLQTILILLSLLILTILIVINHWGIGRL